MLENDLNMIVLIMEYQRKDESHWQDGNMVVEMDDETIEEDGPEESWCLKSWVPQLATIGDITLYNYEWWMTNLISEKKVLPSLVLTSFMIYFVVTIVFYYQY